MEVLTDKIMPTRQLSQQINVWRLNSTNVGLAIISATEPTPKIIEKLSAAREQCERLVVVLPTKAESNSLLWAHSQIIDALSLAEDEEISAVKQFDATLILED